MIDRDQFFITGKAGDIQQMKSSWFEVFVKGPLKYILFELLDRYPEPREQDCTKHNSLGWLTIKDRYAKCEKNEIVGRIAKLGFDLIIGEHQHDPPYEERLDYISEQVTIGYLCGALTARSSPSSTLWDEGVKGRLDSWLDLDKQLADAIHPPFGERIDLRAIQNLQSEKERLLKKWNEEWRNK